MKTLFDYHVVCHRDDNGSYVAYVPAIPGCHAIGDSPVGAQTALKDVFEMIVEEHAERGQPLPEDVKLISADAR